MMRSAPTRFRRSALLALLAPLLGCEAGARAPAVPDRTASAAPAAADSVAIRAAIRAGYVERLRLGLGSPFRLMETAMEDPRLDAASRRAAAGALLRSTLNGDGYAVDEAALLPLSSAAPAPNALGRARMHLELIAGTVEAAGSARAGELSVRLAYRLALAEGTTDSARYLGAIHAASVLRDRRTAREDAQRLLGSARAAAADPVSLIAGWRRGRRFQVEAPALQAVSPRVEREAMERAPALLGELRSLWMRAGGERTSGEPGAADKAALERLAEVSVDTDAPPSAPLVVALEQTAVQLEASGAEGHAAWRGFADEAWNEERFAARYAALVASAPALRTAAAASALRAAVGLRPFAQQRPWFPGMPGPSAALLRERYGVRVQVGEDVPAAWTPYQLRSIEEALEDLRTVLPELDVRGLEIRVVRRPSSPLVLARHLAGTRTLEWPVTTGPGTLAHEIAHDLDWQAQRRRSARSRGYASDRAVARGRSSFAIALLHLIPEAGPEQAAAAEGADHQRRPSEVLARSFDWFVTTRLAAQGRWNGTLSSAQDEVLTGLGSLRPPGLSEAHGPAVMGALRPLLRVPEQERQGFLAHHGPLRWPAAFLMVRMASAPPGVEDVPPSGSGPVAAAERLRVARGARDAALGQLTGWLCAQPLPASESATGAAYRALVREAAAARGRRMALTVARERAGVEGVRWMLRELYGPLWPGGRVQPEHLAELAAVAAESRMLALDPAAAGASPLQPADRCAGEGAVAPGWGSLRIVP